MIDAADRLTFPETPQDMHLMLELEADIKRDMFSFTHASINAFVIYEFLQIGGDNNGTEPRGVLQPDRDAEGDRSIDDAGVSAR